MMFGNKVQHSRVMLSSGFCLATVSVCVTLYVHGHFTGSSVKLFLGDFKTNDSKTHFRCSTKEKGKYVVQHNTEVIFLSLKGLITIKTKTMLR